jgi:leucyl aminopeptidase
MEKMKKLIALTVLTLSASAFAAPRMQWLTVDNQVLAKLQIKNKMASPVLFSSEHASVVKLDQAQVEQLSGLIHNELHRCGGFIAHDSYQEAEAALTAQGDSTFAQKTLFDSYSMDQGTIVRPMMAAVSEQNIRNTIIKLSEFNNRYYTADTGVKSSESIRDMWAAMAKGRSDIKVELFKHSRFPQSSIIMTITGTEKPEEIVILGGHADSINAGLFGGGSNSARAPGSDDNASGIATITEVIRIVLDQNFKPKRTIQFMGYAAEEVGLLGSKDVAADYKKNSKKVVGVMQFDMTLFKGTAEKDIVLMNDFTNTAQNEFIGKIIDEYVKVPWGTSQCGYGCSDHASWTANGYPASFPFESTMDDHNHKIHTDKDTLQTSGGDAAHAAKFAKLGAAFIVELAN